MIVQDSLETSLASARRLLEAGARDRRHPAHTPVVATLDKSGFPSQRVMILRAVDWNARLLRFHTDARSPKVTELAQNSAASVLVYDPTEKVQIRLSGTAHIEADSAASEAAWAESTAFARRCYLAENGPSLPSSAPTSGLPSWAEGIKPSEEQVSMGRPNFAILLFHFQEMEWLYLANSGHRRAKWTWADTRTIGRWLIP